MAYMKDETGRRLDTFTAISAGEVAVRVKNESRSQRGRFVAVGDSITEVDSSRSNFKWGNSWATYAALASAGRMQLMYVCAKGGANTNTVLGLFQTEVVAAGISHDLLIIADGTNDATPTSDTLPNNLWMIDWETARGARSVLATIPPAGSQALGAPADFTLTPLPGYAGGTLAAGTYYYQVATRGPLGNTTASAEKSVTLNATGAVKVSWTPVGSQAGYLVYGRGSGAKGYVWISGTGTSQPTAINQWIDLGTAAATGTLPGSDLSASPAVTDAVRLKIAMVNAVKRKLARDRGVPVVDQNAILIDSVTGRYKKNYAGDGTHPDTATQKRMGIHMFQALRAAHVLPIGEPELVMDPMDPLSILPPIDSGNVNQNTTGGLLMPNVAGGTRPTSWSWYGSTATAATTLALDPNVEGYAYTISRTSWDGVYSDLTINRSKWAVGDRIYVAVKIKSSGLDAIDGGSVSFALRSLGSQVANITGFTIARDVPLTDLPGGWAVWAAEGVVPAGTTDLRVDFNVQGEGASAAIAQLTVRNLTKMGLV